MIVDLLTKPTDAILGLSIAAVVLVTQRIGRWVHERRNRARREYWAEWGGR